MVHSMEAMKASYIEAVNEYLEDQENAFYFEGIRKLELRWTKCIALNGDYIEKQWSKGSLTLAMGKCLWFSKKIKVCQLSLSSP